MSFQIGNIIIENELALGPMAGVTDLPFRLLCKEQGAGLLYTEMVSAKGVLYHNRNTEELLGTCEAEAPIGLQLFGSDPQIMAEQAKVLEDRAFAFFDINMGCPVPKVVNNGEGSALMKTPSLVYDIVDAMVKAQRKPVTVKIRKGFTEANAVEVAKAAEAAGAAAIAVHGRLRGEYYAGKADWDCIRSVKEAVRVPVIGSGDVDSPEKALSMKAETGVDGIMIARAARGNPWIFAQCRAALEGKPVPARPDVPEVIDMVLRHARMAIERYGERRAMPAMRSHVAWYFAGYPDSAALRRRANEITGYEELNKLLGEYLDKERKA
ncbi:MAG: tRNA dihydrouridine synthase DusB [Lachnospiraceae bacterium]|nr:tRNA dihydrouridine synthase DusB [Lachnospiraceae bacterium]